MKKIIYFLSLLFLWGCEKDPVPTQIAVSTGEVTNVTTNSASIRVSMDDNDIIDEVGILCSTDSLFNASLVNKSSTQEIIGTSFDFQLSNLTSGTKYFYKAYAYSRSSSIYGITKSFMTEDVFLTSSINSIEVNEKEGTYKVEIKANTNWSAESNQSWCEVSPQSGTMQDSLAIELKENVSISSRQAIVTIKAGGKNKQITVNQKGCEENLSVSSNCFFVAQESKSYSFMIQTNLDWTISSNQSWCTVETTSGSNNKTISFSVSTNTSTQTRSAVITVSTSTSSIQIAVKQEGMSEVTPILSVSNQSFSMTAEEQKITFDIISNVSWTVASDQTWCVPSVNSGVNNKTVTLSLAKNVTAEKRTAVVTVQTNTLTAKVKVTQTNEEQTLIVNIPDSNFKAYLVANFDTDKDFEISEKEAKNIRIIRCDSMNIKSLQGIEKMVNLLHLICYCNELSSLDISKNINLLSLICSENQISKLDISNNTELQSLDCYRNQLTSLDISSNLKLESFNGFENELTNLDVSKNIDLKFLDCSSNKLVAIDVSNNPKLSWLSCGSNKISKLDVSNNMELTELQCGNNLLISLNVSKNSKLERLHCTYNRINNLDITNNILVKYLYCSQNVDLSLYVKIGHVFDEFYVGEKTTVVYK